MSPVEFSNWDFVIVNFQLLLQVVQILWFRRFRLWKIRQNKRTKNKNKNINVTWLRNKSHALVIKCRNNNRAIRAAYLFKKNKPNHFLFECTYLFAHFAGWMEAVFVSELKQINNLPLDWSIPQENWLLSRGWRSKSVVEKKSDKIRQHSNFPAKKKK